MDLGAVVVISLLFGIICAFVGGAVAGGKGRRTAGIVLGLFFGPIGIVIALLLPATPEAEVRFRERVAGIEQQDLAPCGWCSEPIQRTALVCRWCGRETPVALGGEYRTVDELWDHLYERVGLAQDLDSLDALLAEAGVALSELTPADVHAIGHSAWAAGDVVDRAQLARRLGGTSAPEIS